jgi:hypothetical protein
VVTPQHHARSLHSPTPAGESTKLQHKNLTMAKFLSFGLLILCGSNVGAFSLSMGSESKAAQFGNVGSRRSFFSTACATVVGGASILSRSEPSYAATAKEIITTPSGIKYAVTKESSDKKPVTPYKGESIH